MIIGLGTDILEVARVAQAIERNERFLTKYFTQTEIAYCQSYAKGAFQRYAGRFCAKEAVAKATGKGFGEDLRYQDIEVLNDASGKPYLSESAVEILRQLMGAEKLVVHLSISHCKEYANAIAILET